MATCPNCGKKLHIYDIKAECKYCGVNIPNYNWEERLEEDNVKAERQFQAFYKRMNMLAYSLWGTKLRIARLVLSIIPLVGFILPWATIKSDGQNVGFDLVNIFADGKSLIDIISSFFSNSSIYFTNMGYESHSGPVTFTMLSTLFFLLSAVFIVIGFFLILFKVKTPKTKVIASFDLVSIIFAILSGIMFSIGASSMSTYTAFNFGDISFINATGSIGWGYFVALALLVVAFVINVLVAKAPAKSHEQLESERVARKEVKEEKERQDAIKKEKAREEAAKKAEEEQAQLVAQAKEKLAAKQAKKNKK